MPSRPPAGLPWPTSTSRPVRELGRVFGLDGKTAGFECGIECRLHTSRSPLASASARISPSRLDAIPMIDLTPLDMIGGCQQRGGDVAGRSRI